MKNEGKMKYTSPVLVPLGALAKGSGVCVTGSVPGNGNGNDENGPCSGGNGRAGPYGTTTCSEGASPVDYCSSGTCATRLGASYCTAGFTAGSYCEAGSSPETGSML